MRTELNPDIWNLLHDGTIVRVAGAVPGDVQLTISINYLRRRFPDAGEHFVLTLHECTSLAYAADGSAGSVTDIPAIGALEPGILRAENWTDANKVYCVSGTLRIFASAFSLALDSGRSITIEELSAASEAYWEEFEMGSSS